MITTWKELENALLKEPVVLVKASPVMNLLKSIDDIVYVDKSVKKATPNLTDPLERLIAISIKKDCFDDSPVEVPLNRVEPSALERNKSNFLKYNRFIKESEYTTRKGLEMQLECYKAVLDNRGDEFIPIYIEKIKEVNKRLSKLPKQ